MGSPPIPLDLITGGLRCVSHEEHEIHDGRSFTAHFEDGTPTNIGEETAISFTTPAASVSRRRIHMTFEAQANDESILEFREAPTMNLNGDSESDLAVLNRDRNSSNTTVLIGTEAAAAVGHLSSHTVAQANIANLSGGTILHTERLAVAGVSPFASTLNAIGRAEKEFILLPATDYVLILTTTTVNTTIHALRLNWSEEIPKTSTP